MPKELVTALRALKNKKKCDIFKKDIENRSILKVQKKKLQEMQSLYYK